MNLEAEAMGFQKEFPRIGPEAVMGIELNPYAAELARVSVWIGEMQWMRRNGFEAGRNPILCWCGRLLIPTASWPQGQQPHERRDR